MNEGTPVVDVKTSGDYLYIVHKDGTAEIMRYTGETAERTVPDTLDGHPVTGIGDWAFATCTSLTASRCRKG